MKSTKERIMESFSNFGKLPADEISIIKPSTIDSGGGLMPISVSDGGNGELRREPPLFNRSEQPVRVFPNSPPISTTNEAITITEVASIVDCATSVSPNACIESAPLLRFQTLLGESIETIFGEAMRSPHGFLMAWNMKALIVSSLMTLTVFLMILAAGAQRAANSCDGSVIYEQGRYPLYAHRRKGTTVTKTYEILDQDISWFVTIASVSITVFYAIAAINPKCAYLTELALVGGIRHRWLESAFANTLIIAGLAPMCGIRDANAYAGIIVAAFIGSVAWFCVDSSPRGSIIAMGGIVAAAVCTIYVIFSLGISLGYLSREPAAESGDNLGEAAPENWFTLLVYVTLALFASSLAIPLIKQFSVTVSNVKIEIAYSLVTFLWRAFAVLTITSRIYENARIATGG